MGHRLTKKTANKKQKRLIGKWKCLGCQAEGAWHIDWLCIALHIISKNKVTENSRIMGQSGVEKL